MPSSWARGNPETFSLHTGNQGKQGNLNNPSIPTATRIRRQARYCARGDSPRTRMPRRRQPGATAQQMRRLPTQPNQNQSQSPGRLPSEIFMMVSEVFLGFWGLI